ncbi:MAG: OsmC family protein [Nitrospiraceae bacterium]|nr:OsmC family protein [Nitrospiraceae bacterium]
MHNESGGLDDKSLTGYKEKVAPVMKARLFLEKDLIFKGMTQTGYEIEFDAKVEWGCMPTESLLLSLGGCMAIDTVSFLRKMKVNVKNFKIELTGERNPAPPQFFKKIDMTLHIEGSGLDEKKVKKAVALSHEKYCSVYHSLRKDMVVNVNWFLTEIGGM